VFALQTSYKSSTDFDDIFKKRCPWLCRC